MNLSYDDKERNRKQFDCLFKKILCNEAKNTYKEIARRAKRETVFSELSERQMNSLSVMDEYAIDKTFYQVLGFDVEVRNDLIAAALNSLPLLKREVILLSYFLNMTDVEISRLLGYTSANIHYHRTNALESLKRLLKKEAAPHEDKDI